MNKYRAIYIGDVRFNECNVFELDREADDFVMINDTEIRYSTEAVMEDPDFLVFTISGDRATLEDKECLKL